jgi:hypothetical protein
MIKPFFLLISVLNSFLVWILWFFYWQIKIGRGARWWIIDISIAQWQLTILKKEDQRIPKGTHRVLWLGRSKALSESAHREATNHRKNRKNTLQLNLSYPLPLMFPSSFRLHYSACSVVSPASQNTQELEALYSPTHYMICCLHPETPGKLVPLCKQNP